MDNSGKAIEWLNRSKLSPVELRAPRAGFERSGKTRADPGQCSRQRRHHSWLDDRAAPQVESRLGLFGTLAGLEKVTAENAVPASGGRVFGPSGTAARLRIPRSTLESKIRALKIKSRFRSRAPKRS